MDKTSSAAPSKPGTEFVHRSEAAYQVAKLTSGAMQISREMLTMAGLESDTVELILHSTYTLAYLDGARGGLEVAGAL